MYMCCVLRKYNPVLLVRKAFLNRVELYAILFDLRGISLQEGQFDKGFCISIRQSNLLYTGIRKHGNGVIGN